MVEGTVSHEVSERMHGKECVRVHLREKLEGLL
jgi:hypothetical protein